MRISGLKENFKTSFEVMRAHLALDAFDIEMEFEEADGLCVGAKDGKGYLRCREVHHMNRLLGLFAQYYKGEDFEIKENAAFKTLSLMIDISYRGPISIAGLKEYFTYLATMGYNQIWFYAEDMYEMPAKYAHFGYMRGRYSTEELRELDDFAYSIGIEIVPCIQTLGHMQHYLRWDEAYAYRETNMILRPDSPKVDELIRVMNQKDLYTIACLPALRDYSFGLNHEQNGLPTAGGYLWADEEYRYWLDPTKEGTLSYLASIAAELRALGFHEVVLDDFSIPTSEKLKFDGDRNEVLAATAKKLLDTCGSERFAVSFCVSNTGFQLPEGRSRLYLKNQSASELKAVAEQTALAEPTIKLVFITDLNDTRFDD